MNLQLVKGKLSTVQYIVHVHDNAFSIKGQILIFHSDSKYHTQLLLYSAANWLKPPAQRNQKTWSDYIPAWLRWKYIRNNLPYFIFCLIYAVVNIVLFVEASVRHRDKGTCGGHLCITNCCELYCTYVVKSV